MLPKPEHLGPEYAAQFSDPSVVAAYPHRPPYPPDVFPILAGLVAGQPRAVLDIGCGTGDIARGLAPLVERVDAVDISAPMLALGRTLPGGDHPRLRWLLGRAEDTASEPPYGLITAGESLHWMEWDVLLPRLARLLAPGGVLAIVGREPEPEPWGEELRPLFPRYSTNRQFRPYDLIEELVQRGLFTPLGERVTEPMVVRQPVGVYVESFHSRNGLSRDRMTPEETAAFDREVAALVAPFVEDGAVELRMRGHIRWGLPSAAAP